MPLLMRRSSRRVLAVIVFSSVVLLIMAILIVNLNDLAPDSSLKYQAPFYNMSQAHLDSFGWPTCGLRSSSLFYGSYGQAHGRVIGGDDAVRGEFPWFLALRDKTILTYGESYCGASLIGGRFGLTSAYCCLRPTSGHPTGEGKRMQVIAGQISFREIINTQSDEAMRLTRDVTKCVPHPGYNQASGENDIALLVWQKPYEFERDPQTETILVNTVCLPVPDWRLNGGTFWSSGFGFIGPYNRYNGTSAHGDKDNETPQVLQKLRYDYPASESCHEELEEKPTWSRLSDPNFFGYCIPLYRDEKNFGGPCGDDFGSPIVSRTLAAKDRFFQLAVLTGGEFSRRSAKKNKTCSDVIFLTGRTTMSAIDWIRATVKLEKP